MVRSTAPYDSREAVDSFKSVAAITLASTSERPGESHERKSVIIPGHWICLQRRRLFDALARVGGPGPRCSATGPLSIGWNLRQIKV
jgi:hypothetical protein